MGGGLNATARGACSHAVAQNLCRTLAICIGKVSRHCENVDALESVHEVNDRKT